MSNSKGRTKTVPGAHYCRPRVIQRRGHSVTVVSNLSIYKANGMWSNQLGKAAPHSQRPINANKISNHVTRACIQERVYHILHKIQITGHPMQYSISDDQRQSFSEMHLRSGVFMSQNLQLTVFKCDPLGEDRGHCSQREDRWGSAWAHPSTRDSGQSTAPARRLTSGSAFKDDKYLCPYL